MNDGEETEISSSGLDEDEEEEESDSFLEDDDSDDESSWPSKCSPKRSKGGMESSEED